MKVVVSTASRRITIINSRLALRVECITAKTHVGRYFIRARPTTNRSTTEQ
jgi:hypothetical protein